jgi:hypothetical protein
MVLSEISGSYSSEYKDDDGLLGYFTMSSTTRLLGAISQKAVIFKMVF